MKLPKKTWQELLADIYEAAREDRSIAEQYPEESLHALLTEILTDRRDGCCTLSTTIDSACGWQSREESKEREKIKYSRVEGDLLFAWSGGGVNTKQKSVRALLRDFHAASKDCERIRVDDDIQKAAKYAQVRLASAPIKAVYHVVTIDWHDAELISIAEFAECLVQHDWELAGLRELISLLKAGVLPERHVIVAPADRIFGKVPAVGVSVDCGRSCWVYGNVLTLYSPDNTMRLRINETSSVLIREHTP
jgi:hypothetical protein